MTLRHTQLLLALSVLCLGLPGAARSDETEGLREVPGQWGASSDLECGPELPPFEADSSLSEPAALDLGAGPFQPLDCTPAAKCCKVCSKGKACGNTCIRADYSCHKERGCACNSADVCKVGSFSSGSRQANRSARKLEIALAPNARSAGDGRRPRTEVVGSSLSEPLALNK